MRALLAEDDDADAATTAAVLVAAGLRVERAENGADAFDLAQLHGFDVVVLGVRLADMTGAELVRRLRQAMIRTPILMLGRADAGEATTQALVCGADDQLGIPFEAEALAAKVDAMLGREEEVEGSAIRAGRMTVDLRTHAVAIDGRALPVTPPEFRILELLAMRRTMTLTPEMLDGGLRTLAAESAAGLDTMISMLRQKIAAAFPGRRADSALVGLAEESAEFEYGAMPSLMEHALAGGAPATAGEKGSRATELDRLLLQLLPLPE